MLGVVCCLQQALRGMSHPSSKLELADRCAPVAEWLRRRPAKAVGFPRVLRIASGAGGMVFCDAQPACCQLRLPDCVRRYMLHALVQVGQTVEHWGMQAWSGNGAINS